MIITLKGADFSSNNIGTLSTWTIFTTLGTGATYSGVRTVDKNAVFTATVTIAEGYEIGTAGITVVMGSTNITSTSVTSSGNVYTITIGSVTGNVTISVHTKNTAGGEEPDTPTSYIFTINPDPTSATVTLSATGYSTVSGTGSQSITVANGTKVNWSVSANGYTEQNGTWTANGSNENKDVELTASGGTVVQDFADQIKLNTSYNTGSQAEGTKFTTATPAAVENNATLRVQVSSSNTYELRGVGNGYAYRLYSILDDTDTVLTRAGAMDTRTEPYVFNPPENADEIIINFIGYDASKDSFKQISQ